MSLSTALETLANYRANNIRASQETFDKGTQILKSNAVSRLGDDCKQHNLEYLLTLQLARLTVVFNQ